MGRVESLRTENKLKKTEIGEIPVDWEVARIGDTCEVVGGSTPLTTTKEFWDGDIPWAIPTDITKLKGNIISITEKIITERGLSNCAARLLPVGSILLTSRATIGECAINSKSMATNQGFASLICKDKVYNWFIFYRIKYMRKEIERLGSGSTFNEVSKKSIRELKIPIPPLSEQKKIAEILISVDEAIEKKQEIIEKTKMLKKGLMQELLTRGIGHKKFKKTEIGEIPVDWEINSVKNHTALITKGTTPTTYGYSYTKEGVLFLRVENIGEQGKFFLKDVKYISEETNRFLNRSILQSGDILISIAGALGRVSVIPDKLLPANINQALAIIRLKDNSLDRKFLMYVLTSQMTLIQVNFMAAQLAQANLNLKQVGDLKFPLPNLNEQRKIAEILTLMDEDIENEMDHKERLEGIKKGLMQVLLTGKIRAKI